MAEKLFNALSAVNQPAFTKRSKIGQEDTKNTYLMTDFVPINGLHKYAPKVFSRVVSFDLCKAKLLAFKFPLLGALLRGRDVVSCCGKIRVSSIRRPCIKCKGNISRYVLRCSYTISDELEIQPRRASPEKCLKSDSLNPLHGKGFEHEVCFGVEYPFPKGWDEDM